MDHDETVDLLAYLKRLKRYLIPASIAGLVVLALFSLLGLRGGSSQQSFATKAHVAIRPSDTANVALAESQTQLMPQIMRTFVGLEDAPSYTEAVSKRLNGKFTPDQVAQMTTLYWGGGSLLLAVKAQAPTEEDSKALANAGAQVIASDAPAILGEKASSAPQVSVVQTAFDDPDVPKPAAASKLKGVEEGLVAGVLVALITAVTLELANSRRRRSR